MRIVDIEDLKFDLSGLLKGLREGEELIVAEDGKPIAKIVPIFKEAPVGRRKLGLMKGKMWVAPDAWDPDPELERLFYEGDPSFRSTLDDHLDELAEQSPKEDMKD